MCEFCMKHGEGKKWYLQAKNYSNDLLSDLRRRKFIEHFFSNPELPRQGERRLDDLAKAPKLVQALVRRGITRKMKKDHFGQVVPIEEIEEILRRASSIVRIACYCRHTTVGKEKRYCYGVSLSPSGTTMIDVLRSLDTCFLTGPDTAGLETLTSDEAIAAMRAHEHEGLCHTVWTFNAPFIGGICNCDRSDCYAMRFTVTREIPLMFRAEYVAEVDPASCAGCRECIGLCQFGAITYSAGNEKAVVDQTKCYGCGICRAACAPQAIRLLDRRESPVAANLW